jgi:hypothetical protein
MALVELRLSSIPTIGSPLQVLSTALQGTYMFPGSVLYVESIDFCLLKDADVDVHLERMASLVRRLEQ